MSCVFCKIINKEIPAEIVSEDDEMVVFKDIKPSAPVHLLIVPKKHISSMNEISDRDKGLIGNLFLTARKMAEETSVKNSGYKLIINTGRGGGQVIDHLHIHLQGGWK